MLKMKMNDRDKLDLARRIDQGILLAHTRLIERAKHDNLSLIIRQGTAIVEVPAVEL